MRLQRLATVVGLAALVQAGGDRHQLGTGTGTAASSTYWVTTVVPTYTTYCPSPTTWAYLNTTYSITSETTITLPCPCTVSISSVSPITLTSTYTTDVSCTTDTPTPSGGVPFSSIDMTDTPTYPVGPIGAPSATTFPYTASMSLTTITSVPAPSTLLSGTTDLGGGTPGFPITTIETATATAPTHTPVAPTTSPVVVTINGAYKAAPGARVIGFVAGLAALIL